MILTIFLLLVAFLLFILFRRNDGIDLPGPNPWPVIGNLLQIDPERPHRTLDKWHKQYNGLYKIYNMGEPVIVVGHHKVIHEVLVKRGTDFSDRPSFYRLRLWSESGEFNDGVAFVKPDYTWKLIRQTAQKLLKERDAGLSNIEDITSQVTNDLIRDLRNQGGRYFDPKEHITRAVLNNFAVFLTGQKYSRDDEVFKKYLEIDRLFLVLFGATGKHAMIDTFPWLRFFWSDTKKEFRHLNKRVAEVYETSKEAVAGESADGPQSILAALLKLLSEGQIDGGELRTIKAFANLFVIGGGTPSKVIYSLLNILTHNNDVLHKLQAEIDEVIGDRPVALRDKEKLPYVRATIFETLRYTSVVPIILRQSIRDSEIGNAKIPAGTTIFINLYSNNHDEAFWDEPEKFKPERFLDEDGHVIPPNHENRKRLFSFGAGFRVCPGEAFAMSRLFVIGTSIIQHFDIEQQDPKVPTHPRAFKNMSLVFVPNEFKVKMTYRRES